MRFIYSCFGFLCFFSLTIFSSSFFFFSSSDFSVQFKSTMCPPSNLICFLQCHSACYPIWVSFSVGGRRRSSGSIRDLVIVMQLKLLVLLMAVVVIQIQQALSVYRLGFVLVGSVQGRVDNVDCRGVNLLIIHDLMVKTTRNNPKYKAVRICYCY
ncbi:hypothetical protein LINPERHAP2_LOCUS11199 [Linum perenne]